MADEELYGVEDGGGEEGYEGDGGEGEDYNEDGTGAGLEELEAMTRKLKEMEEEAARLKAMQGGAASGDAAAAAAASGPGAAAGTSAPASNAGDSAEKEEADGRSIYIGNVDYATTPEELQQHFQSCGTVNRVTILTDRTGNPKGYAYLEFLEVDAVQNAVLLDNSELRGRQIKVSPKRTNVPGLKAGRGRGRGRGGGGYPPYGAYPYYPAPYPFYPPPFAPPFAPRGRGRHGPPGFGPAPRGRGRGRFAPY